MTVCCVSCTGRQSTPAETGEPWALGGIEPLFKKLHTYLPKPTFVKIIVPSYVPIETLLCEMDAYS